MTASAKDFTDTLCRSNVTISDGTATSSEADLCGTTLVGLLLPASLTSIALTFTAAPAAGGAHVAIVDSSKASISITVDANSRVVAFTADQIAKFQGARFLKVVGGGNETGDKIITLLSRPA